MTIVEETTCCIVGGGPAGAMLGWLLARAGVPVVVLEKHPDFLRDFRGDTIHSSTIQIMDDLGVVDDFLSLPHQRESGTRAVTDDGEMELADFSLLDIKYPFIAYMPQWEFLDYIVKKAQRYDTFKLEMNAEVVDVIWEGDRVAGVRYRRDGETHEVRALLTVACDGRHSRVRKAAGLEVKTFGAPMDLMWFRLPRLETDPGHTFGRLSRGQMLALIHRGTYWQSAYVVPKSATSDWRGGDISALRQRLEELVPWFAGRTKALASWDDVHLLDVRLERVNRWHRPGLLVIGDAAHAMSVVGGVGVNLAVQDAVATARLLAEPLRAGKVESRHLAAVQRRRMPATVLTQRLQRTIQDKFLVPLLAGQSSGKPPKVLRTIMSLKAIQRAKARLVAVGFRPERADRMPELQPVRADGGSVPDQVAPR